MGAFGLYTHIRANRIRSALLLIGLFVLIYLLVFATILLGEAMTHEATFDQLLHLALQDTLPLLPFATLAAMAWILIAYLGHQTFIRFVTKARTIKRTQEPLLYALLENLCISRGMSMPGLAIIETPAMNAYASGMSEGQYTITVTRGLLNALDEHELEAVLAHELTHIRNQDVRLMIIAMVIAGAISFFGEAVFRWLRFMPFDMSSSSRSGSSSSDDKKGGAAGVLIAIAIALLLVAIAWLLSHVIRFSLSRTREYLADAGAVDLTKNPDAMISALRKIRTGSDIKSAPSAIMAMCLDNPRHSFVSLFSTHPTIDDRIEALVQYAGGTVSAKMGNAGKGLQAGVTS